METRKIDEFSEARLKEIDDGYYAYVVVTYVRPQLGEFDQKYYMADEYDKAYADFMSR